MSLPLGYTLDQALELGSLPCSANNVSVHAGNYLKAQGTVCTGCQMRALFLLNRGRRLLATAKALAEDDQERTSDGRVSTGV